MSSGSQGMCPPLSFKTNSSSNRSRNCSNIQIAFSSTANSNSRRTTCSSLGHAVGAAGGGSSNSNKITTMLYYSLDPQFAAFVYSLYARHERPSLTALFPDALGCPDHATTTSADLLSYAHAVSLQLLALGEHYACLFTQCKYSSLYILVKIVKINP